MNKRFAPPPGGDLSRRAFLVRAGAGVAAFGFAADGALSGAAAAMDPGAPGGALAPVAPPAFSPALWYEIDSAGLVHVNIVRAEMGQHVGTALARVLADELEADLSKIRLVHVDFDPKWEPMVTGGSWSVSQSWTAFSRAGAAGRIALVEAGARLLGAEPAACAARAGRVVGPGGEISYGEIVSRGVALRRFSPQELDAVALKKPSSERFEGPGLRALDIPPKIDGTAIFGIDAKAPGMIYGRPLLPPTRHGSKLLSIDDSAARSVKGYIGSVALDDPSDTIPGWVMTLAETYPAAIRAAGLVRAKWAPGPGATVSEADLQARARALIADPAAGAIVPNSNTDTKPAFDRAAETFERTYTTATALHVQLEPVNALAFEKDGVLELHAGNQWQSLIMPTLVKAFGRPQEKIALRTYLLGGGFGRRLNGDYLLGAGLAALKTGRPVKVILTREDDAKFDSPRSPSVQVLRAALGRDGEILGQEHHACAGWPTLAIAPGAVGKGEGDRPLDPFAYAGADHWYDIRPLKVRAVLNDLANETFRPGWLRSVGPGWTNWALESFIDELAHRLGKDPVAFRLELLRPVGDNAGAAPLSIGGAARQAEVVRRAAQRAGWGVKPPRGVGLGLATSFGQERTMPTWCACVARVRVDEASGAVTVEKLTLDIDAGAIVDPDGARAQATGGAFWGVSLALHEGTEFENGLVKARNFDAYTPMRISQAPQVDVAFAPSVYDPSGMGEPATTVVGPAIGNAIFNAVGVRLRHLPIRPADVLAALKAR